MHILIKLLLARHGETEWNRLGRYQGQSDIELNATGMEQAQRLRRRLESETIDTIYCSDLKRAKQTAQPISLYHNLTVEYRKELRELHFGEFEGKCFEEIKSLYASLAIAWQSGNLEAPVPGGETLAELGARIIKFVTMLNEHHTDETVLVVAHGGCLQMMICHLIGLDFQYWWRLRLDGASLSILHLYPELNVLSLLNGTAHLLRDVGGAR